MVAQVFDPLFGLSTTRRDTARRLRAAGALVVVASNKQTCGGQAVHVLGDCVLAPLGTVAPASTPHKRLVVETATLKRDLCPAGVCCEEAVQIVRC